MIDMGLPTGTEFADLVPALRQELPWASVAVPSSTRPWSPPLAIDVSAESVLELLSGWARTQPDRIALAHGERSLDYGALELRTTRLAHELRLGGVEPGQIVPLTMGRGIPFFETAIALWKLRAGFLPVDPAWPRPWRESLAVRTGCPVHVTVSTTREVPAGTRRIDVDLLDLDVPGPDQPFDPGPTTDDVAYAMRTSGTTGEPKVVVVEHRGLAHLIAAQRVALAGMDGSATVLQYCSPYFDSMIFEWGMALGSGGRLEIVDPHHFATLSERERHRITHACLPAVVIRTLTPADLPNLRVMVSSGDICFPSTAREWSGPVQFVNGYGPTETTVCATMHVVETSEDGGSVPIGTPLPGIRVTIVDDRLAPVPDGEAGEILIGGEGVARGYLGQPDLTAERFPPDPVLPGRRAYRTGDLGRVRSDGAIEYLGRRDDQVKVRGHRVDTAEVEQALAALPSVRDAVVIADSTRMTGFVRTVPGSTDSQKDVRDRLARIVPAFLVPDRVLVVEEWPMRANGKIDRSLLLSTSGGTPPERPVDAPPFEPLVRSVLAELLDLPDVSPDASPAALGCDSLTAMRLVARLRAALGRTLPVSEVLTAGSVSAISSLLVDADADAAVVPGGSPVSTSTASYAQERIWIAHESTTASIAYNGQCVLRLAGELDLRALNAALTEIVRRHDVLRSSLRLGETGVEVSHVPPWRVELPVVDLTGLDPAERDVQVGRHVREAVRAPFDVRSDRLVRWLLVRLAVDEHLLVHTEHHAVHDALSFNVFLHDLVTAYNAFQFHGSAALPPLPAQYEDYARRQRRWCASPEADEQRAFWTRALTDAPAVLPLPLGRRTVQGRAATPGGRPGAAPRLAVDGELAAALERFGRRHEATLYMVTLTAYFVALHRMSGATDVLVAAGTAARTWPDTEDMLGMFINTVVLRGDLEDDPTLAEALRRVRTVCLSAYDNQELPLEEVMAGLEIPRVDGVNPLIQVAFNFHESLPKAFDSVPFDITVIDGMNNGTTKFDISVTVFPRCSSPGRTSRHEGALLRIPRSSRAVLPSPPRSLSGMDVVWKYDTDLFDAEQARAMITSYVDVLRAMADAPETRLSEIDVLPVAGDLSGRPGHLRVTPKDHDHHTISRAPRTAGEGRRPASVHERLTALVSELLGVPLPQGEDDFFALGGDSLTAVQLLSAVSKEFGVSIPLERVYADSTLLGITATIETEVRC
ncbi:amino acid adenylation domain-containing protein [Streptomyces sp. NPDC058955]|uniref:amino acid adenylation domain-containing protein n=1 Tax=unclassified Streptomyces TaxID=2593676 RepID=UPI0036541580